MNVKSNQFQKARKLFSINLKKFRFEKKLTQEELAYLAGLHRTYIGSVERGERNISIDNIERLAVALNIKIEELLKEQLDNSIKLSTGKRNIL